jgi:Mrp family chromosome partitioning ATPase
MVKIHESVSAAQGQGNPKKVQDASLKSSLQKIKKKFIVMSGKGGVGKTCTSVNLSIALANKGFQVGVMDVDLHGPDVPIMDVDLHGPDVPRMLGLKGMLDLNKNNKLNPVVYSKNLKVVSIESLTVNKDDAIIWRGPLKYSAIRQFIGEVEWGNLDFLIIDSPPGTGDEPLTVAQTIIDAKAIIVTTPQEISLADVRKSISFCKTVKMELFGLIENMSGFTCPHCNEIIDLFGSGGGEKTAEAAGIQFLGKIPFDHNVVSCGDDGVSYQEKYADSQVTQAFAELAEKISNPNFS